MSDNGWNEFRCACGHKAESYKALGAHLRGHRAHGQIPPQLEELKNGGLGVLIGYVGASEHCTEGACDRMAGEDAARAQVAQQNAAAGKMFSRTEVLAVLRAQKATWRNEPTDMGGVRYRAAHEALDDAIGIFERME